MVALWKGQLDAWKRHRWVWKCPRGAARCTQNLGQPHGKAPTAHPGKGHFVLYFDSSLFSDAGGAGAEAGSCSGFLCPHPGATSPSLSLSVSGLPACSMGCISELYICFPGGSKPLTFSAFFSFYFGRFPPFLQFLWGRPVPWVWDSVSELPGLTLDHSGLSVPKRDPLAPGGSFPSFRLPGGAERPGAFAGVWDAAAAHQPWRCFD